MMHLKQCTHTCVAHLLALTQPSDDKTTRTRRCHQTCVHLLLCAQYPCASYTVGSGHTMCIIYSISNTAWYPQMICFRILVLYRRPCLLLIPYGQSQICTRPPPLKIHFLCQHQDLCIPDSEEIDPVYFEKVNLGTLYSTGDRNISKQEREKQQGTIKFGIKYDLQMTWQRFLVQTKQMHHFQLEGATHIARQRRTWRAWRRGRARWREWSSRRGRAPAPPRRAPPALAPGSEEGMFEDGDGDGEVYLLCRVLDLDVNSAIDFVLLRHGDTTHPLDITKVQRLKREKHYFESEVEWLWGRENIIWTSSQSQSQCW